ncbi:MAG: MAPEG family protein [Pseudomonadota bacterium]
MEGQQILQPVVVLAAWTMVMWLWMYATRIPAMQAAKVHPDNLVKDPEASLERFLPPQVMWKAHNYNHLHEAPTVFYAVAIVIALTGTGEGLNLWLAWAYVALRIAHSLVQATINRVMVRFALFAVSSLVLLALIVHAAIAVF